MSKGQTSVSNTISSATGNLRDLITCVSIPLGLVTKASMTLIFPLRMQQEKGTCALTCTYYVSHN